MDFKFELATDFILGEGVPLTGRDLADGVKLGFIKPRTAVELATRFAADGYTDPIVDRLARLFGDELHAIYQAADASQPRESRWVSPIRPGRVWRYLQLKAAYSVRGTLVKPWEVIARIFAEFDYPESMAPFVYYMPARAGDESGEDAMLLRWSEFLESEQRVLSTTSEPNQTQCGSGGDTPL